VTLPLDVEGWHAVHLGLWPQYGIGEKPHRILAKLSDDPSFVIVGSELQDQYSVDEVFWKYADLTGQSIVFDQYPGGFRAGIACVKLVPVGSKYSKQLKQARTTSSGLQATEYGHPISSSFGLKHSVAWLSKPLSFI
jgi:hypothetical protein